ncbi:DUF11 domain-containing protein [Puniceibacterium sediminis]|uniref:DUF11 domain-containing protein n=1 Tax=Puniceibacterium sediminis TaxID=1608407 RepID=UPI001596208C|nr:DUF11 domain-containing protein [Puniceibacterium sediminis]
MSNQKVDEVLKPVSNRFLRMLCSGTAAITVLSSPALAETCSVSPTFVNWITPGTLGGLNVDQSATLQWGSAATDISISGPLFIFGGETSITRISEYPDSRGTYSLNFGSPVVHDLNIFVGNVGRNGFQPLESGIVGDFNMTLSGGGTAENLFGAVTPLDNQGYFQIFGSDTEGIAQTALTGTGADGLPLDGKFWVHDPNLVPGDINNGGEDQAYGMIDLAYTAPTVVSGGSDTITQLTLRQVGVGVGPTVTLGVQARLRSCINAADDDFSSAPIASASGGSTGSVLGDDLLNGGGVDTTPLLGNVDLAVVSLPTPAVGAINLATDTGEITVEAGTTPGTYFVEYSLTDRTTDGTPTNTDTATATVVVGGAAAGTIVAVNDDYTSTPVNAAFGGSAGEVLTNDTANGIPALFPNVTLSVLTQAVPASPGDPVPTLVTSGIDAGRVVVPSGVPAGVYTIDYLLCDAVNSADCDTATVTIAVFEGNGLDFGDAPLSYLIPTHAVASTPTIYLGAVPPDTELVAQSDGTATGDDIADTNDEDGVTFPILTQGLSVTLDVEVTGNGYLQAWLDFDGDGLFATAPVERIATDLRDDGTSDDNVAGDGIIQINITVPDDATTDLTFARFRYGSEQGLGTTSFAVDGEVEDYSLIIAAADLVDRGDAPASYGDPRHVVVPQIYLGSALPDTETSTRFSTDADGDDLSGSDDEDATTFPQLVAGTTVPLTVQTHETLSVQFDLGLPVLVPGITNLQLWIDFDQNGVFDTSEQVAVDYRDGGTGDTDGTFNNQISLNIPVPTDIGNGTTYARLRWSTTSGIAADPFDGLNMDGEVEDYLVTLSNPNGPLTCSSNFYMVATEPAQNLPALDELSISESGGIYTLSHTDLPPDYTGNYLVTGWGYNELDGYIYGVGQSPRNLYQINASGAVRAVADISGLSLESPDTSSDILPNGIMIYMSGTDFSRYQLLDISDPANPVALGVLTAEAGAAYGRDMAYNPRDGLIYFVDTSNNLHSFDPRNGVPGAITVDPVASLPLPAGKFSIDIDSVWFDGSGFMYAFDNQSRQVFALEVGSVGARPASYQFIEVLGTIDNLTYQGNDGASCRAPGPFVSSIFAEGAISGTLYQDADGSDTRDTGEPGLPAGITVTLHDDNGTPADPADDTLALTTETTADGSYAFGTVDSTLTYRIEVDTTDPEIPAGLTLSTTNPLTGVAVTTGAETTDQDFGFVAAPTAADLSLSKSVVSAANGLPVTQATAGEALDFILTVTNDGPGTPTGVQVRDLMPQGFAYVSDDAGAQGDTYDTGTGIWALGDVPAGSNQTLTIRVTMRDSGEHTNTAEIVASSLPDPDSDPAVGALVDDLSDGLADDDEASVTLAFTGTGATLSGVVFLDNGAGATAYDGVQEGAEAGTDRAVVAVYDSAGALIGSPAVAADGSWSLTLPDGYTDAVTVSVLPDAGLRAVSETAAALPGLVNTDPRDGSFTFTPAAGTSYSDLSFGLIVEARLNLDQQAAIRPGQVVSLRHEYVADATGSVSFIVENQTSATPGAFSTGLFLDTDCDGTANTPITDPVAIQAATLLCIVTRVSASSAVSPGASYSFDLVADTSYGASGLNEQDRNTDRVTVESSQGALKLTKTVRNVTQGSAEGVANAAAAGDVLEYRIYVQNAGTLPSSDIIIYDRTPPYTVLANAVPSPVDLGGGVTCISSLPGTDSSGYAGDLRWNCTGSYQPGADGSVTFQIRISP